MKKIVFLICLFISTATVWAQPGFGDDVEDAPLDGGLSLLVAAGVGYGAKKLYDKNKKETK